LRIRFDMAFKVILVLKKRMGQSFRQTACRRTRESGSCVAERRLSALKIILDQRHVVIENVLVKR
jgi:hypothetical protein